MSARADIPTADLIVRYETGEDTPTLALAYGVSPTTIWRRLHAAGIELRPSGGPLGNQRALGNKSRPKPQGPLHWSGRGHIRTIDRKGVRCLVHRGCWEACRGPIPEGWVVHHVNGDKTDNHIENLACMSHGEHTGLHNQVGR